MKNDRLIYLDHAATTPVAPEVLVVMKPYFDEFYGNPSSIHQVGRRANVALQAARQKIAELIGARPSEIIFTSCGSESDNAALRGIAMARRHATGATRIVTSAAEHKAVLATAEDLYAHYGFTLTVAPVDDEGRITVDAMAAALGDGSDVAVASVLYANNEIGTIQPIAEIGALCRGLGVPFHTDAVQAGGKVSLNVDVLQVDALSAGAHKFYGPKGVGFLYLRSGTPFLPYLTGGSHEGGRRAGTENVPLIVGMARALELAEAMRSEEGARQRVLRDQLIGGVLETIDGTRLTGPTRDRLDNHASFLVPDVGAEGVLIALDLAGIAASSGSACASGAQRPSHVLEAIGVSPTDAAGALRFSLGRSNSAADIVYTIERLVESVARIRNNDG